MLASGSITVDGLISANGANALSAGTRHPGGGAGGSVYLSCQTFSGQGGTVRANGGNKAVDHSGGDLALTNQGWMVAQNLDASDGLVQVNGRIDLATNCWVYPISHQNAGGVTRFVCREMRAAAGGGFNADGGGYSEVGAGPGAGVSDATSFACTHLSAP